MRQDDAHGEVGSRGYVAFTGAMIGAGIGIVWLHSAIVETCLFALLGAFLAWTLAGEWRPRDLGRYATDGETTLIATEPMPLIPMLSWPAPFPVQVPVATRQDAPARHTRRAAMLHCTAPRRHATTARARRITGRGALRRTSR
ncbi:MAG: hypothetical protein ACRDHE_06055 [Ktedonobacterales bacterium]